MIAQATATKRASRKPQGFYTSAEASRIAQVPDQRVRYWRRSGLIVPSARWIDESDTEHLGYTFETVVFLRLLRILRHKGISLYDASSAVKRLKDRCGTPSKRWSQAKIWVDAGEVFVYDGRDTYGTTSVNRGHQVVAELIFREEFALLKQRADALLIPREFMVSVEIDPAIQNGLPIVRGTKILTGTIHYFMQQGYTLTDVEEMYSFISGRRIIGAEKYETFLDKASLN